MKGKCNPSWRAVSITPVACHANLVRPNEQREKHRWALWVCRVLTITEIHLIKMTQENSPGTAHLNTSYSKSVPPVHKPKSIHRIHQTVFQLDCVCISSFQISRSPTDGDQRESDRNTLGRKPSPFIPSAFLEAVCNVLSGHFASPSWLMCLLEIAFKARFTGAYSRHTDAAVDSQANADTQGLNLTAFNGTSL